MGEEEVELEHKSSRWWVEGGVAAWPAAREEKVSSSKLVVAWRGS